MRTPRIPARPPARELLLAVLLLPRRPPRLDPPRAPADRGRLDRGPRREPAGRAPRALGARAQGARGPALRRALRGRPGRAPAASTSPRSRPSRGTTPARRATSSASVLDEAWVLDVARVCSRLEAKLAKARTPAQRVNATRGSDLELERVDMEYSSRAGANNAHFLLTRKRRRPVGLHPRHGAAGGRAERHRHLGLLAPRRPPARRPAPRSRPLAAGRSAPSSRARALAAEWYGVHFLQDAFASGHVAGTWGDTALRKGTHDYYNAQGLEHGHVEGESRSSSRATSTCGRRTATSPRPSRAGASSSSSTPSSPTRRSRAPPRRSRSPPDHATKGSRRAGRPSSLRSAGSATPELVEALVSVLKETPVPGLGEGLGALPRFRAEIGPFAGVTGGFQGIWASGGFDSPNSPAARRVR